MFWGAKILLTKYFLGYFSRTSDGHLYRFYPRLPLPRPGNQVAKGENLDISPKVGIGGNGFFCNLSLVSKSCKP